MPESLSLFNWAGVFEAAVTRPQLPYSGSRRETIQELLEKFLQMVGEEEPNL
jgi:hypothetical protein